MPKNIILKGSPIRKEGVTGAKLTPGMLIDFNSSGALIAHGTAGGTAAAYFAVEEDFLGKGIDKEYASGDRGQYVVAGPGDEVYAILDKSQEIVKGDFLMSSGDGTLKKYAAQKVEAEHAADVTITLNVIVGRALEAVTTTSAATKRIRVEVI